MVAKGSTQSATARTSLASSEATSASESPKPNKSLVSLFKNSAQVKTIGDPSISAACPSSAAQSCASCSEVSQPQTRWKSGGALLGYSGGKPRCSVSGGRCLTVTSARCTFRPLLDRSIRGLVSCCGRLPSSCCCTRAATELGPNAGDDGATAAAPPPENVDDAAAPAGVATPSPETRNAWSDSWNSAHNVTLPLQSPKSTRTSIENDTAPGSSSCM
mmetsp:Transcript_95369/g.309010  ORF Transcript_95369/g.309010 Transcript_95369/m.309010 type:complete len:217 (+) Transcript_95369:1441-2091(+)